MIKVEDDPWQHLEADLVARDDPLTLER